MPNGPGRPLTAKPFPNRSIFEISVTAALIGMGAVGILSQRGIESSTFFPVVREVFQPIMLALFMLALGMTRALVLAFRPGWRIWRASLSAVSSIIWLQWVVGFIQVAAAGQGLRPGMMQIASLALGEMMVIYWLASAGTRRDG